jgi:hypothetical protein
LIAPSQSAAAVAGVQNASRQQYSLVPLRHTSEPSAERQLSIEPAAWAWAAIGAASAADANSTATIFNFFIDSPLEEGPQKPAKRRGKTSGD